MIFSKNLKNISTIGVADITTNGIGGFFWFYLATLVLPTEFGEIHYFISTFFGFYNKFNYFIYCNFSFPR